MYRTSDCFLHVSVCHDCTLCPNCLVLFLLFISCVFVCACVLLAIVYFYLIARAFFWNSFSFYSVLNSIFIALRGLEFYVFHSLINLFIFITMLKFTKRISRHSWLILNLLRVLSRMEVKNDKRQAETSRIADYKLLSAYHVNIVNVGAFSLHRMTNCCI